MDTKLDLFFLVTQGQYSDIDQKSGALPHGFYIYVEEEIITVRRGGSPSDGNYGKRFERKKKITLKFRLDDIDYVKEVIIDDINLSVKSTNISLEERLIEVNLYNISLDSEILDVVRVHLDGIE